MLENCKTAKERWGGVNDIIDRWLLARQNMLVRYYNLSTALTESPGTINAAEEVRLLCQMLVDYVSAGHFEVYDQLIKEGREFNDKAALSEAGKLYQNIDDTTEIALDFNDKYLETDDLTTLERDLSQLGVSLEARFEAEDRMIAVLHVAHKDLVA